jgi:hypothetical protein
MPGGRPSKRTPEITARICEAISYGLTQKETAALVEINVDTLLEWGKLAEFASAVEGAKSARKLTWLKAVANGDQGWQSKSWLLERQDPARFARPEIQLQLNQTSVTTTINKWQISGAAFFGLPAPDAAPEPRTIEAE